MILDFPCHWVRRVQTIDGLQLTVKIRLYKNVATFYVLVDLHLGKDDIQLALALLLSAPDRKAFQSSGMRRLSISRL